MKYFIFSVVLTALLSLSLPHPTPYNDDEPSLDFELENDQDTEEFIVSPEEEGELFEGDIELDEEDLENLQSGIIDKKKRWPNNTVLYQVAADFNDTQLSTLWSAMKMISKDTCIKFQRRKMSDKDYVAILNPPKGCTSYVGRKGGRQNLSLADSCFSAVGIPAHQLIHAIGFYHEQARTDRDDFVTINFDNVKELKKNKKYFEKYNASVITAFNISYDYDSVMHSGATYYAVSRSKPTIVPKKKDAKIGQRKQLSKSDIQKINKMYECKKGGKN